MAIWAMQGMFLASSVATVLAIQFLYYEGAAGTSVCLCVCVCLCV
jgi:hypothetical protein